ncbi:MAG: arsenite methyltransferase [Desulfobacteraceae bacterium]|nr:arsenite methyltransferase [Desulfobacteraceae bacterium]
MDTLNNDKIRRLVSNNYGKVAKDSGQGCGCMTASSCCGKGDTVLERYTGDLGYTDTDINNVPEGANMGLGCGNPQSIALLRTGETVLDLGSGGGFDCFLAAKSVGPDGLVIGVDMTPEMLHKARDNARTAGVENVEFRLGEVENLPVADNTADVIMSNCVINLSPEKTKVYAEAFRVLKPGGRLAISDMVAVRELPSDIKENPDLLCGCVGGAETVEKIKNALEIVGFESIDIKLAGASRETIEEWFPKNNLSSYVASASIQAEKPSTQVP